MKKAIIILGFMGLIFAQETNLASITAKLDQGTKLYQNNKPDSALVPFQEAANGFEQMLQGVLTPEDEAYTKYFLATAKYYIARIQNDASQFEETSKLFNESAGAFKGLDIVGEEYVRSKYMKALCSFRLYQLANTERAQIKKLDPAIGDFNDFVNDEDVQKHAEDFQDLIDNAQYFLGYCQYRLAYLQIFDMGQLSNAQMNIEKAIESFQSAKKSSDERVSLAASLMEANCHYLLTRLFFRVSDDDWDKYKLSKKDKLSVSEDEINESLNLLDKMISASGTQKDLQMFGKVGKVIDELTLGSVGSKDKLNDAMTKMTDLKDNKTWGKDVLSRLAYGSLLNYLIYNGPPRAAITGFNRVSGSDPEALYWVGVVNFIQGTYDQANAKLTAFSSQIASNRSTRAKELLADAKYRQAECLFWMGVRNENSAFLSQADAIYKALENPKGEYYDYLTKNIQNIVTVRRFLIGIETSLGKEKDVSVFDAAMSLAGLQLPKDADKYLDAGQYFLQKAIEVAADKRNVALKFAIHAFDKVINASVSGDIKNKARFMKGVALVKRATIEEKADATKTIEEAKAVLDACTSPYNNEAKYVVGKGYFNNNEYDKALSILQPLKAQGHIRAAYTYALVQIQKNNCVSAAKALGSIKATIKDRTDQWYQRADLELSKLSCRGEAKGAPSLARLSEAPMTYENLVDEDAEKSRKKAEALFIWQRSSKFVKLPDIDELIPDRPPETNVKIEIAIEPPGGEEQITIDGKEGLAELEQNSVYKVTLNRGTHKIQIKKKGFYLFDGQLKVTKSEKVTFKLAKAVRYTPAGEISGTENALAVATNENEIFVAPMNKKSIVELDKDGKKIEEFSYSSIGIGGVSGLAMDGDRLIIVDPKQNQVIALSLGDEETETEPTEIDTSDSATGSENDTSTAEKTAAPTKKSNVSVIAYSGETYGSVPLSRPAGICVDDGVYYIADAGNHRILVFEGNSFRKEIGVDTLVHPVDVAVKENVLYVADIGLGKIVRFSTAGEFIDEVELENQSQPSGIFVSPAGFIFVSDFVKNTVVKYTDDLEPLSVAGKDIVAPRSIAQIGSGPESIVYVSDLSGLTVLKGGWDNTYIPK